MAGRGVFDASHEAGVLDRGVLITSLARVTLVPVAKVSRRAVYTIARREANGRMRAEEVLGVAWIASVVGTLVVRHGLAVVVS